MWTAKDEDEIPADTDVVQDVQKTGGDVMVSD